MWNGIRLWNGIRVWNEIRVVEWETSKRMGMDMVDWECRKYNLGHGESEQVVRFVRFHDEMVPRVRNDCILSATLVGRVLL